MVTSSLLQSIAGDLRFAIRHFARHRATTTIIVAVLALGTGANTVIFSLFQSEFLRPAPSVPEDASHVRIWSEERATPTATSQSRDLTGLELRALAERGDVFRSVAAWIHDEVTIRTDSAAARDAGAQFVTPEYFTTLGVPLAAGRGLAPGPIDQRSLTAVMSHLVAESLFGSAAGAVGRRVLVNEVPLQVVGVAPPRFQGAVKNMDEPALWIPLGARTEVTSDSSRWLDDREVMSVFASLAPGASPEQATAVARQVVTGLLPDSAARVGMTRTAEVVALHAPPPGDAGTEILLVITLVFSLGVLILLVACMNVSSLMVAAAVARRHEIAVRLALGASRLRLIRQLVTESTLLAVAGGAAGLLIAYWVLTGMMRTEIDGVELAPDAGTFAFALVMAVATGILFGLSPALNATRGGVANALRDSGGGSSHRSRLQRALVVSQIAASQPLLVLLGVMLSLVISDYQPLAPTTSREVIQANFRPIEGHAAAALGPAAVASLIPRLEQRPDVRAVVPASSPFDTRAVFPSDRAAGDTIPIIMRLEGVAPGWLALLDVPVLLGRDVALGDTASSERPVVIGADLARALWGEANPIGRRLASPRYGDWDQDSLELTVVGVYDATRRVPGMSGVQDGTRGVPFRVYTAHAKRWRVDRLLIRTRGPAAPHLGTFQRVALAEAPSVPLLSMRTLEQIDENEYRVTLRISALAGAGGALALLLASLGLYGVIALAVRQRTREIGIRIAVGAYPMKVARLFLRDGVRTSLIGLAIGLPLSIGALQFGLSSGVVNDAGVNAFVIGAAIAVLLVMVAAAATWIPARRASRVDPATALRVE